MSYKIVQQEQQPQSLSLVFVSSSTIITSGKFGLPLLLLDSFTDPREGAPGEGADSWIGPRMDLVSSEAFQLSFGVAVFFVVDIVLLFLCLNFI